MAVVTTIHASRRQFLRGLVAAGVAGAAALGSRQSFAQPAGLEKISEDDPAAKALGYKHDATTVDVTAFPKRGGDEGATQFCNNCALYQGGAEEWGGCGIFPGKAVAGKGWCNAWVPKQG